MNMRAALTLAVVTALIVVAVFGLFIPFEHGGHHCLFSTGGVAICDASIMHLQHWQSALVAALAVLTIFAAAVLTTNILYIVDTRARSLHGTRRTFILCPTLIQELFSDGILNPKLH